MELSSMWSVRKDFDNKVKRSAEGRSNRSGVSSIFG